MQTRLRLAAAFASDAEESGPNVRVVGASAAAWARTKF